MKSVHLWAATLLKVCSSHRRGGEKRRLCALKFNNIWICKSNCAYAEGSLSLVDNTRCLKELSMPTIAKIKIPMQLTFELMCFLTDLSPGLTKSSSSTAVEGRTGDSGDCETWHKSEFDTKLIKHCYAFSYLSKFLLEFTFEPRRVLADLSFGLTKSSSSTWVVERIGDWDCEIWNNSKNIIIINNS